MEAATATPVHSVMTGNDADGSFAAQRRRQGRREEWTEQSKFTALLTQYLDPSCAWFTSLENKPLSRISGMLQKKRGVKSGLPDVIVLFRHGTGIVVVFIELKSRRGIASKAQKQTRLEMLPAGAKWRMVRTARAGLTALYREGAPFRRKWTPPKKLEPWEGPFENPHVRLPQHPDVARERAAAQQRYRERRRAREAALTAERRIETDFPTSAPGDAPGTPWAAPPQPSRSTAEIISFPEGKRP
jgi:hypothetical protein